eukprot:3085268-Alexandrium_andersonii.AAC.1
MTTIPRFSLLSVARHHAASRHHAARVLLRNHALCCAPRRAALQSDVACNAPRCDAESAPRCVLTVSCDFGMHVATRAPHH